MPLGCVDLIQHTDHGDAPQPEVTHDWQGAVIADCKCWPDPEALVFSSQANGSGCTTAQRVLHAPPLLMQFQLLPLQFTVVPVELPFLQSMSFSPSAPPAMSPSPLLVPRQRL